MAVSDYQKQIVALLKRRVHPPSLDATEDPLFPIYTNQPRTKLPKPAPKIYDGEIPRWFPQKRR